LGKNSLAIKPLVHFINRTSEVRQHLQDVNSTVAFEIEGEKTFYFRLMGGKVHFQFGRPTSPDVTLRTDSDTFFQIMIGKISQEEAFDQKLILLEGAVVEAIRFRYITNLALEKNKLLKYLRSLLSAFHTLTQLDV
jgi:putative sterol carrier protein